MGDECDDSGLESGNPDSDAKRTFTHDALMSPQHMSTWSQEFQQHPLDQIGASFANSFEELALKTASVTFDVNHDGSSSPRINHAHPVSILSLSQQSSDSSQHPLEQLGGSFRSSFKGHNTAYWSQSRRGSLIIISRRVSMAIEVEPLTMLMLTDSFADSCCNPIDEPACHCHAFDENLFAFHFLEQDNESQDERDTESLLQSMFSEGPLITRHGCDFDTLIQ